MDKGAHASMLYTSTTPLRARSFVHESAPLYPSPRSPGCDARPTSAISSPKSQTKSRRIDDTHSRHDTALYLDTIRGKKDVCGHEIAVG